MTNHVQNFTLAILVIASLVAACAEEEPSPGEGQQTLEVTAATGTRLIPAAMRQATLAALEVCATEDPIPGAVDDEFTTCLLLQLDPTMIRDADPGDVFAIDGTAQFELSVPPGSGSPGSEAGQATWFPSEQSSAAVVSAQVTRSCYCSDMVEATQAFQGRLTIVEVGADSGEESVRTVRLEITMSGVVPPTYDATEELVRYAGTLELRETGI